MGGEFNFAPLLGVLSVTTIVAAIAAVAAIKVLPSFTRWGYKQVIKMFGA